MSLLTKKTTNSICERQDSEIAGLKQNEVFYALCASNGSIYPSHGCECASE